MLVRDGVIEKMFADSREAFDPFGVSDADSMLDYLAPGARKPINATVFSRDRYPFCVRAKGLLSDANIAFEGLLLNRNYQERSLRQSPEGLNYLRSSSMANLSEVQMNWKHGSR